MDEMAERKVDVHYDGGDERCATYVIHGEDHTLGNAIRYALMRNANVEFAGYSIPHPLDDAINLRVQTVAVPATQALHESLDALELITTHIQSTFANAVADYEAGH